MLSCLSFLTVLWSEKEFHGAAKRNDLEKMQELIKKGVDIKAKNKVSLLLDKYAHFSCFTYLSFKSLGKTNHVNQVYFISHAQNVWNLYTKLVMHITAVNVKMSAMRKIALHKKVKLCRQPWS